MGTGIKHKTTTPGCVINSTEVWAEEHQIDGHVLPNSTSQFDLGSSSKKWRYLYLGAGGLRGIGIVESGDLASDAIDSLHASIEHLASMLKKGIQPFNSDITFSPYGTIGGSPDSHDSLQWTSGTIQFADGTTQSIDAGNETGLATGIHYVYFTVGSSSLTVTDAFDSVSSDTKSLLAWVGVSSTATQEIRIQVFHAKGLNINADVIAANAILTAHIAASQVTAGKISVVGLDSNGKLVLSQIGSGNLDNIGNGSTYGKVRLTQIDAGNLKLTSSTVKSGEWYDVSGVEIDANHGINIYGTDSALTTRATKTGTIQCKVTAGGKISAGGGTVLLDSGGLTIDGQSAYFKHSGSTKGYVYAGSGGLLVNATSGQLSLLGNTAVDIDAGSSNVNIDAATSITLDAGTSILLDATSRIYAYADIHPNVDSAHDIGLDAKRFANGYFDDIYGTTHDFELADMTCPLCGKDFEVDDSLTFIVKRVDKNPLDKPDRPKIVTVPAHLRCSLKKEVTT